MSRSLGTATGKITLDIAGVERAVGQLRASMGRAEQAMAKAGTAASRAGKDVGDGLKPAASAADKLREAFGKLGPALAGLTAGLTVGAVFKGIVDAAGNFEQAMARVGAVSGATGEDMAALTGLARELGATTSFSASQAAEGMQYLAMAGFDTNEIIDAMPGLLNAAAAAQMDLGRTADIVSNILTGFGLEANESGRAADVLVYAASNANTTVEQLGGAMKYVAPVAASLGISMEDATAAIAKMSDAGIQGEMAGTALRGAMIRLSAPTKEAASLMQALGIEAFDANGNMKPLPDVVGEFARATADMTAEQRANALQTIIGTEAMAGFLALMEAGPAGLQAFGDELRDSAGTAAEIAAKQMDTLQGSIKEFWSAVEGLQITLGNLLLPALRQMVDGLTVAVRATEQAVTWATTHGDVIREKLLPVLAGLGTALTAYALTQVPAMIAATAAAIPVVLAKAAAMGTLAAATLAAAAPFVVLGAAVGGAVLIYQKWNSISEEVAERWLAQNREFQDSIAVLGRYETASRSTQAALRDKAEALKRLQAEQRADLQQRADLARAGQQESAAWKENTERINARTREIDALTVQLDGYLDIAATGTEAELRAALAADQHAAALRKLRDESKLTEDEVGSLAERMTALSESSARGAQDVAKLEQAFLDGLISAEQLALSLDALERSQAAVAEAARLAAEASAAEAEAAQAAAYAEARRAADAQLAYGDVEGALATLRAAAGLTAEEMGELSESLVDAAEKGRDAFRSFVSTEAQFLDGREQARSGHQERIADMEASHTAKLTELQTAYASASSEAERTRLAGQMADLKKGHADQLAAEQEKFAEQERQAAAAYAQQQAAQQAHLGQMLIEYTVIKARMVGISGEKIAEMTRAIAAEYGVQRDIIGESFNQTTDIIDAWVARGGENVTQHIADMGRARDASVQLARDYDRIYAEMTAEAAEMWTKRMIESPEAYAEYLRTLPERAMVMAEGLRNANQGIVADTTTHHQALTQLQQAHHTQLAELQAAYAAATTEAERTRIAEEMAAVTQGFAERTAATQTFQSEQLIAFAMAKAEEAGIETTHAAEMVRVLQERYGEQRNMSAESYAEITAIIAQWAADGGTLTDQHLSDLDRVRGGTEQLKADTGSTRAAMIAEAASQFAAGEMSIAEYANKLRSLIPGAAREASAALNAIPRRVESEVVITTRNVTVNEGGPATQRGPGAPMERRASGGPIRAGRPYLVGEEGPELIIPTVNGVVLPAGLTQALTNAGGNLQAAGSALAALGAGSSPATALPASPTGLAPTAQITITNTFNGPVFDTAERVQQVSDTIVKDAVAAWSRVFERVLLTDGGVA